MTGQATDALWPSSAPPTAQGLLQWQLADVAELPAMRGEVRRTLEPTIGSDVLDQIILALDEMASNALRHGGGGVRASIRATDDAWLLEVSDAACGSPPAPAVGRDPSEGGLGLYLIAELARDHGWYDDGDCKHVWALLPRA